VTPSEPAEDQPVVLRIDQLPRDVGWLLVYVGVLGVVLPGIIGTPFLIAGGAVLVPGGPKLLMRWAGRNPPRLVHASMKQISRLVDDLERRYPACPAHHPDAPPALTATQRSGIQPGAKNGVFSGATPELLGRARQPPTILIKPMLLFAGLRPLLR
jgi:hypothetical protein